MISLIVIVVIVMVIKFMDRYTFLPWNIMVMAILTGITGAISFITGAIGIIGGVLQRKAIVLITMIAVILSCSVVTFIGLYSFSGVVYTENTLQKGWNNMDETQIPKFEEIWECHGFNAQTVGNSTVDSNLPYCSEALKGPFTTYSIVMLTFSCAMYLLLLAIVMVISKYLLKDDPTKSGFEPIGAPAENP